MSENKTRPGVMLYFDTLCPALARLSNEQNGMLLRGIVDYAQTGTIPELDGMTGMAFDLLRPSIDRDGERYAEAVDQRRYAVYCREAKKHGEEPMSFEEWQRVLSSDNGSYPTTTSTPISNPSPTTTPSQKIDSASTAGGVSGGCKGDNPLSPEEKERRRREMQRQLLDYRPGGANG